MSTSEPPKFLFVYLSYLLMVTYPQLEKRNVRVLNKQRLHVNVEVPNKLFLEKVAEDLASKAKFLGFITTHHVDSGAEHSLLNQFFQCIDALNKAQDKYKFVIKYKSPDFCNANYWAGNYLNFFIVEIEHV
ncbi:MAG TPA: hypothetical protein VFM18_12860 [Methanosarcina sp.]|nr:hypothetical protein [Methanosarcina sp.]